MQPKDASVEHFSGSADAGGAVSDTGAVADRVPVARTSGQGTWLSRKVWFATAPATWRARIGHSAGCARGHARWQTRWQRDGGASRRLGRRGWFADKPPWWMHGTAAPGTPQSPTRALRILLGKWRGQRCGCNRFRRWRLRP